MANKGLNSFNKHPLIDISKKVIIESLTVKVNLNEKI